MAIYELDPLDKKIINSLLKDSRVAFSDLAKKFKVAPATIHLRVGKLREAGILLGSHAQIDYEKLGIDVFSLIGISLRHAGRVEKALEELLKIPEVFEAHYTTGTYSLLIKVAVSNMRSLHLLLTEKIQLIEEIQATETFVILKSPILRQVPV